MGAAGSGGGRSLLLLLLLLLLLQALFKRWSILSEVGSRQGSG